MDIRGIGDRFYLATSNERVFRNLILVGEQPMATFRRIFAYLLLFGILTIPAAEKILVVNDPATKSDVCKAMSGALYRLEHVLYLYKEGLCEKLAFIGGKEEKTVSYAARMSEIAINAGIPPSDILIDEVDIFSSHAELVRLRYLLESQVTRPSSVTLVTSGYHTRRTKLVWNWLFDDSIQLTVIAAPNDANTWLWWKSTKKRKVVALEYTKIVFYYLRYRINFPILNEYLSQYDKIND